MSTDTDRTTPMSGGPVSVSNPDLSSMISAQNSALLNRENNSPTNSNPIQSAASASSSARRSLRKVSKVTTIMLRKPTDKLKGVSNPWSLMVDRGSSAVSETGSDIVVTDVSGSVRRNSVSMAWQVADNDLNQSHEQIEMKEMSRSRETALTHVEI